MTPADIDLYKDDLTGPADQDLYNAIEVFTRIAPPQKDQTQEGYLLDFKATWNDSALRTVAAFANTFGGLLLIGVSEKAGRADELAGIVSRRHELKTAIASAIASNISPTPPYDIRDVGFPDGSGRHLCIVRVRKGTSLYMLTKKGEQPVYVRNEDQSIRADAARLQALLAVRSVPGQTSAESTVSPPSLVGESLYVTQAQPAPPGLTLSSGYQLQRMRSSTYLRIQFAPEEPQAVRLDLAVEQNLRLIVRKTYPELADNVDNISRNVGASFTDFRLRHWYQFIYHEDLRDYEMGWGIDSSAGFYFVAQVRCKTEQSAPATEVRSLGDVITNLDCTIEAAHRFWDYLNYPSEARVLAQLYVEPLPLLERAGGSQTAYASCFYEKASPRNRAKVLTTDRLTRAAQFGTSATASVDLTYATRFGSHAEPVVLIANQFLRDLGYSASLDDLRSLFL
ncbi:MAG: ATP-binding protein [Candidatus Sulfotelmatobacter sp.]